jgi:hypothetical protein
MLFYYPILPAEMVFTIGGILLFTTTYSAIKGQKQETGVTSKPDRFTKTNAFFKCRDTNLFATGNAARNYNKVSNGIYGGDFSGGGSSGEF